jgi:hypothetical protein
MGGNRKFLSNVKYSLTQRLYRSFNVISSEITIYFEFSNGSCIFDYKKRNYNCPYEEQKTFHFHEFRLLSRAWKFALPCHNNPATKNMSSKNRIIKTNTKYKVSLSDFSISEALVHMKHHAMVA